MRAYRFAILLIGLSFSGNINAQSIFFCELSELKKLFKYSDIRQDSIIELDKRAADRWGFVYVNSCKKIISYQFFEGDKGCSGVYFDHESIYPLDLVLIADTIIYRFDDNQKRIASYYVKTHADFDYWYFMGEKFGKNFFYKIASVKENELPHSYVGYTKQGMCQYEYPPYNIIDTVVVQHFDFDSIILKSCPINIPYFICSDKCNLSGVYVDSSNNRFLYNKLRYYNSDEDYSIDSSISSNIPDKKKFKLKKKLLSEIPRELVELRLYKEQWYLYAPSDWGAAGRAIITDSTFVDYNMEGSWSKLIKSIKKLDLNMYLLELRGQRFSQNLVINVVSKEKGIILLGHLENKNIVYDRVMSDANKMNQYPCIVNYSPRQKAKEFKFEIPNYQSIIDQSVR